MLEKWTIPRQKIKIISGEGQCPLPRPLPYWEGTPPTQIPPPRCLRRLDTRAFGPRHVPPIRKSWIRLCSYRFRDKRRFRSKIANFSQPPLYFAPPLKGFPLELGIGAGGRKTSDGATGQRKKFDDIFSRVDRIHQRVRWTDRHRVTAKTALKHSVARWKPLNVCRILTGDYLHVRCILLAYKHDICISRIAT